MEVKRALVLGARLVCVALGNVCLCAEEVKPFQDGATVDGLLGEGEQSVVFSQGHHTLVDSRLKPQERRRYAETLGPVKGSYRFFASIQGRERVRLVEPGMCVSLALNGLALGLGQRAFPHLVLAQVEQRPKTLPALRWKGEHVLSVGSPPASIQIGSAYLDVWL
jgi:hypothetical protein